MAERAVVEVHPQPAFSLKPNRGFVLSAAPRRVLKQSWTKNLFAQIRPVVAENASTPEAKRTLWWAIRRILARAECELTDERQLTYAWLAGFPPPGPDVQHERQARALLGRLLKEFGLWSLDEQGLFRQSLAASAARWNSSLQVIARRREPTPSPPDELCKLVRHLAYGCGLSTGQMQKLRVTDVRVDGIQTSPVRKSKRPGHVIPFGCERNELPKTILEAYVGNEKPTDHLFYCRSPRDKKKPLSRQTLTAAVAKLHPEDTIESLRDQHFSEDFNRAFNLREFRFHLRNFHCLSNDRVHKLIDAFAERATTFPVPEPYVAAVMCASGLLPQERTVLEGGRRCSQDFRGLLGRWDISIERPLSLFNDLAKDRKTAARVMRLFYRTAFEHWLSGQKMKPHRVGRKGVFQEDRDLLDRFALTDVHAVDRVEARDWSGRLFEFHNQKRGYRIPLIEVMSGGSWHTRCKVCGHPQRAEIERQVIEAIEGAGKVRRLTAIGSSFGVGYQSLRRHAGLNPPVPGRGNTQRSHIANAPLARIIRCPREIFRQVSTLSGDALLLYSLLLIAGPGTRDLSTQWVWEQVGLRLTDHDISLHLNALSTGVRPLVSVQKTSHGWKVNCEVTNRH